MGIIRRVVQRFLLLFPDRQAGMTVLDDPGPIDTDREYLLNLHHELERSGRMAILERSNRVSLRCAPVCPLKEITVLHRTEVREATLPDTRILPLEDMQEIVMAETGQQS